ncbi:SAM (and some other nucleotide) binding motif:Generic methyltransferase:Bacterial regulatory protein, ArsR [Fulvimarina pelagi HTCC2506]|uniref:SAM (And some other nucleotide) binding motif:Generic methyltransferase:Bacterial regulatory protein, ArsR n=2 Tax=Fulvimarina pelagi TaxID=217511 RepID=Q0G0C8_9HYPH|nr:metalloregulator ArsR/SmtB family transcription factor [Fulvimarina pelagi]EAU40665.1 SAM (and some other nucleotide) binding motif:Generic methyltransferase:Bacterial regulatory protein, ArsR [Fulvimarina pelagi HTCC2506]BAT31209.1 generic methyltransferase [Fulvimarina pelagi]
MASAPTLDFERIVDVLKALAEPTRLRLAMVLKSCDLTVSELTTILGQSQPRISRHLKLMSECGVLERYQEGAFAYFRVADRHPAGILARSLETGIEVDDAIIRKDRERLEEVRADRARRAADYFARNAEHWDKIRALHVPDAEIAAALDRVLGKQRIGTMLDIGTGTGRMMEMLANRCERMLGVDTSREMISAARAKLDDAKVKNAQLRVGDAYNLPANGETYDLVVLHQVLHYLDEPMRAVREASSVLAPGGRLVIVDFAPHEMEFLRTEHAHLRLGFPEDSLKSFLDEAGLETRAVEHLRSGAAETGGLTVTICIGQDRRMLLAPDEVYPSMAVA